MDLFAAISLIITLSALLGYINHRWLKFPPTIGVTVLSLIVGVGLKIAGAFFPETIAPLRANMQAFDFSSFVMNSILCFLLFAGSLHVNMANLKNTWASVLSYATVGTLVSTFLIGVTARLVLGWFGIEVPFIVCLLFGSLISPTDPIAVIGILSQYSIPKKLKTEIIGESLFNDGVGVVLFTIIFSVTQLGPESLTFLNVAKIFSIEVGGGIAIGLVIGYAGYLLMRSIDYYQTEIMLSLAIVMGGYSLAHYLHASGPLAMVVAGLLIGNKGKQDAMSDTTAEYVDKFWELVDEICNTVLFVLIGLEIFLLPLNSQHLLIGGLFIVISLLARYISLFPAYMIFNRKEPNMFLGLKILTWGGLRGGISIALALTLTGKVPHSDLFLVLTFCVVIFSILIQGLSIKKLLKRYTA